MTMRNLFVRVDKNSQSPARRGNQAAGQQQWLRHAATATMPELFRELNSSEEGLAAERVDAAREFYGANAVAQATKRPLPLRLLAAFADPFTYILVFIAAVSVLTDWIFATGADRDLSTPLIIGTMVLVSGVLRFIQDEKSTVAAEALAEMVESCAEVERDGDGGNETPIDEIVIGDVVHLSSGDVVPADLRIFSARDLFVSQASLTGESEPVEKRASLAADASATAAASAPALTDLESLAFMGSTVISGNARGIVVATGARTMFGEATGTLAGRKRETSFDAGIKSTSRLLMRLMLAMLPVVFVVSGATKGDWVSALLFSLSVAVGLTPEMLPMLVTTCLGKGAVDLSRHHVIVKRLDAIQDLGAIDVLCTDKTGTLTEDRIVLERHLDVNGREDARVLRYAFLNSYFSTGVKNLIDNAIVERALAEGTDEVNATVGSTTTAEELAERYHGIDELPFDFERRRLSVVVGDAAGHTRMVTKGALEEVLAVCSSVEVDGQVLPLTDELRTQVVRRGEALADEGMRVLGVARKNEPAGAATLTVADERNMVLIGYLAFLDPPKESSAAAIRALAAHGVATKVLTGDSPRVAAHVCRAIGIDAEHVLTGVDVEAMNDGELADAVQRTNIFAKLSPAQKARVVRTLRGLGHAVAYMGDGVNDAAAMRESDCGISVDSAVDVAREAADIILLEKDLMVLERGIECGRRTYANVIKYVKMTVSSNFGNIASVLVAAALLPFLPMTAVQLLLLNLIYDLTCTAIPWDNVDEDAIRTPRRWDTASVRRFMVAFGPLSSVFDILTFAALFFFVCPAVAGGAWGTLDAAGQALFVGTFQAGWFVESMWTQTLVVHLIRTEKVPFVGSRASLPLCALGATGIAVACVLPVTPLGAALDFCALPATFWPILATMVAGYAALAMLAKRRYVRRNGSLL
ncbi:magnesium-translocating P-type ATPase [Parolsenella catena]|uniref:Magnesium-transporting ATPase, P-type 1 n=1 Tax=Parolsenella catena TaxID=2003188 RepID=A0A3G9K501_9ACTN|nr:magnesium-translocating P-type ATPase [Parolsenella catena]BBH49692.1 magnesium-translocating P-type ATPase [Parolsenella catena]